MSLFFRDGPYFFKENPPLSLRNGPLSFKNCAFRAFQIQSQRGWDLQGSKLKGIFTSEKQGNALHQDCALVMECAYKL